MCSHSATKTFSALTSTRILLPGSENVVLSYAKKRDNSSQLICAGKHTLTSPYKFIKIALYSRWIWAPGATRSEGWLYSSSEKLNRLPGTNIFVPGCEHLRTIHCKFFNTGNILLYLIPIIEKMVAAIEVWPKWNSTALVMLQAFSVYVFQKYEQVIKNTIQGETGGGLQLLTIEKIK